MRPQFAVVLVMLSVLSAWPGMCQTPSSLAPHILATVGEFNVTPAYFDYVVQQRFAREVMAEIIRSRVIEDEARAQGISVTAEAVSAEVARQKAAFPNEEDFTHHLNDLGLTVKGYREHIRTELLGLALLAKTHDVSDAEAKAYYDAHSAEFGTETQLHVLDIATATQEDALVAYRALLDGTPFDVAARRFGAEDAAGKDGDLGWVTKQTIALKPLWDFAQALSEGDTSEPFELDGKFHILRLAGRRAGATATFDSVKSQIKTRLRGERGLNPADYVTTLLAKARISVPWQPVAYLEREYQMLKGIRVAVDGRVLHLTPSPVITDEGAMLIPAKPVLQAIGAVITWRAGAKVMEIKRGDAVAKVALGERTAVVDGDFQDMNAAAVVREGVTFIPPRAILTALGVGVGWNPTTRLLAITTTKPAPGAAAPVAGPG